MYYQLLALTASSCLIGCQSVQAPRNERIISCESVESGIVPWFPTRGLLYEREDRLNVTHGMIALKNRNTDNFEVFCIDGFTYQLRIGARDFSPMTGRWVKFSTTIQPDVHEYGLVCRSKKCSGTIPSPRDY